VGRVFCMRRGVWLREKTLKEEDRRRSEKRG
jgi:hypothetical protein